MQAKIADQLLKKVISDYSTIAEEFSDTRKYEWKEFEAFKKYIKKGQKVADIGCGNGRLRSSLSGDIEYIGVDNNQTLLNEAQKIHAEEKFILGDLLNIPIEDNFSDVTFCIAAMHHIPSFELRQKAIRELRRITQPKGFVILSVWDLWQKKYWKNAVKALLHFFFTHKYDWNDFFIAWGKKVKRYYHAFTEKELKKLITTSGLEMVEFFRSEHNFCIICRKK